MLTRVTSTFSSYLFFTGFCVVVSLLTTLPAHAVLVMTDITGSLDGGSLSRINSVLPQDHFPDQYNDGGSGTDFIVSTVGIGFYSISASNSSMTFSPLNGFVYEDLGAGRSVVTFTGLNSQGDNWTGLSANPFGAGTLLDANTLEIDFANLVGTAGEITTPSVFTLEAAAVPEPHEYAVFAGVGLVGFVAFRRRLRGAQTA